jgi:hypothetical protein
VTNTCTESPFAAAAGPDVTIPPSDDQALQTPPLRWRVQTAPSAPRATSTTSPAPREAAPMLSS